MSGQDDNLSGQNFGLAVILTGHVHSFQINGYKITQRPLPVEMQIANISDTFSDQNFYTSHALFSNKFLSVRGDSFASLGYYFKINIFNILTGQKRDMTELKFVWPVNLPGNCSKIILSPEVQAFIHFFFQYLFSWNKRQMGSSLVRRLLYGFQMRVSPCA